MPEHQGIEKGAKIAKKNIFDFLSFWSGLNNKFVIFTIIFFNMQGKKRRHSRATASIFDEVDWKILQYKCRSYFLNDPKLIRVVFIILIAFVSLLSFRFSEAIQDTDGEEINSPADLGKKLFFDKILSKDYSISCSSCHKPAFGFADNVAFSKGVNDERTKRNVPSVMNVLARPHFFYNGQFSSLEAQATSPIESETEMDLDYTIAVQRIQSDATYDSLFRKIYSAKPDSANIVNAIAEFQRSLESDGSAPHDQWMQGKDEQAMSASQIRGRELFLEKAKCFDCHFGPDFTGDEFRNIGLYDGKDLTDAGRFEITKDSSDLGKFKVPGLRNVGLTAPYMHNGQFETLEEVMDYYDDPYQFVAAPINMDSIMIEPLNLTEQEKEDLVNFMHSLTDANIPCR